MTHAWVKILGSPWLFEYWSNRRIAANLLCELCGFDFPYPHLFVEHNVDIAPQTAPPIAPSKAPPPKARPSDVFGAIVQNSEWPNEHQTESAVGDQNAVQQQCRSPVGNASAASFIVAALRDFNVARMFGTLKKFFWGKRG